MNTILTLVKNYLLHHYCHVENININLPIKLPPTNACIVYGEPYKDKIY